jgi:hypothetical protein
VASLLSLISYLQHLSVSVRSQGSNLGMPPSLKSPRPQKEVLHDPRQCPERRQDRRLKVALGQSLVATAALRVYRRPRSRPTQRMNQRPRLAGVQERSHLRGRRLNPYAHTMTATYSPTMTVVLTPSIAVLHTLAMSSPSPRILADDVSNAHEARSLRRPAWISALTLSFALP